MRIGIFGTFDVENYGDLLFPIIAERELKTRLGDFELVRYSYHEKKASSWCYDVKSLASLYPPNKERFDCILIGGGHLIRFDKAVAPGYRPSIQEIPHPTGYWLAPALAGVISGIPVMWNVPSASDPPPAWAEELLAYVLNYSSYVALRDRPSLDTLRKVGFKGACSIVPDTVFALSHHFPRKDLHIQQTNLLDRLELRGRYIIVQATPHVEGVTKALLSQPDMPPDLDVLALPIGPVLGDDVSHILKFIPEAKHLQEWPSPDEIACLVSHSDGVIAYSLHLSITALAYGIPVLRPAEAKGGKYTLLQASDNVHFGSPQEPSTIAAFVHSLQSRTPRLCSFTKSAHSQLQKHWDRIAEICQRYHPARSSSISNPFAEANLLLTCLEKLGDEQRREIPQQEIQNYNNEINNLKAKLRKSGEKNRQLGKLVRGPQVIIINTFAYWSWRIAQPLKDISHGLVLFRKSMAKFYKDTKLGIELLKREGIRNFSIRLYWYLRGMRLPHEIPSTSKYFNRNNASINIDYNEWIEKNDTLNDKDRSLIRRHIGFFEVTPKFSVLMPVYNIKSEYLRQAIDSVIGQLYDNWELCIADDASTSPEVHNILREYEKKDYRIKLSFRPENGGISACTNTALEMATGDWIILMDHDDLLSEHALYMVTDIINNIPDAAIIYSDEDKIDSDGQRSAPYFKPDWDYDLFLGQNFINHLGAYRIDLARKVNGFREGFEGSQDWDFALRAVETIRESEIHHIPFILYHWRQTDASFSNVSLELARDAAERLVNEHFERTGQRARANPQDHSSYQLIKRELPIKRPLVSIIIPTKDHSELLKTCVDGVVNRTDYKPIEIVIVDNGSSEPEALEYLKYIRSNNSVRIIRDSDSFNFSRLINNGVANSSGEVCVLLNNDTEIINSGWLDEMVSHSIRPEVGVVGAKLYYPDNTIQHGGVITGVGYVAGHAHRGAKREYPGYFHRLLLTHNLSCVTAACLAVRREIFDEIGGFNEKDLTVAYNDVDFCLRIRQAGYKIIWTPHAELYHHESKSRGYDTEPEKLNRSNDEKSYMRDQWGPILDNDPFYNPNLSLDSESIEIALNTRANKPWLHFTGSDCLDKNSKTSVDYLEPIFFVHIPKTAGTSLRNGIEEVYGKECIAYDYGTKQPLTSPCIRQYVYESRDLNALKISLATHHKSFVVGHFSIDKYLDIVNAERCMVFFREPVQRVLSEYNHFVNHYESRGTLSEFISNETFRNKQWKFINGISVDDLGFIGITERYEKSIKLLNAKYGLSVPFMVRNVGKYDTEQVQYYDDDVINLIAELNSLDIELYQKALNLFERRYANFINDGN